MIGHACRKVFRQGKLIIYTYVFRVILWRFFLYYVRFLKKIVLLRHLVMIMATLAK